ncbi:MAG TPA: tetratricopeptide repeat protein [Blastocatellia bacterium]|nr:tetratricopeptide repeat protein [Blastocatellia bacterium]
MTPKADDRLFVAADLIDTGAILEAQDKLKALARFPITCVLNAEVAVQCGRLDEAAALLNECANDLSIVSEVARFARAEGELMFAKHEFEKAASRFESSAYLNELQKSRFGLAWSLYGLARTAIAMRNYAEAENYIEKAQDCLKLRMDNKGLYLQGLLNFKQATVKKHMGDLEESERLFRIAIDQLNRTEKFRNYGLAMVGCAELFETGGRYGEAITVLEQAITLFRQHGLSRDLAQALIASGRVLLLLKRSDDAERHLIEAVDLNSKYSGANGQCASLLQLTELYLRRRLMPKAQSNIEKALAIARQSTDGNLLGSVLILQARILIVLKEPQAAISVLEQAVEHVRDLTPQQHAQCYIYFADAYHAFHVSKGQDFLVRATELMSGQQEVWLKSEYDSVVNKYRRERVVVNGDNKFIIDGNLLPEWEDAKRGLEVFLLRNALKQSENNMTQAGKLLGISKVHVHTRRKQYGL